jgi:1-aminocyclopropane-1-carboxylate deaminase
MELSFNNITTDRVEFFPCKDAEFHVLRLDKVDSIVSGNKWFKLRYYIDDAKSLNKKNIITFGGSWSNHIVATAAACRMSGLGAFGIIRGEKPKQLSETLKEAGQLGMQFHFTSRDEYSMKVAPPELQAADNYIIPEGGFGAKGVAGAATILEHCKIDFSHCCCAVGTGTMLAGLSMRVGPSKNIIGISVLKNNADLEKNVQSLTGHASSNWSINHDYHFGGYAKHIPGLFAFMNRFYEQTLIPSDFVYTAKLFYAVSDLAEKKYFPGGSKVLVIHSGGLQGNTSLKKGTLIF